MNTFKLHSLIMAVPLAIGLIVASTLLLLLLSLLFITYCKLSTKLKPPLHDIEQPQPPKPAIRRFTSSEIDAITSTLTPSNVIGHGGSSTVYSATLVDDVHVALKLHHSSHRLHLAFHRELHILLLITHPHVVRILGYCDNGPDQGVLVFEYIPNGNLHDALHSSSTTTTLSWFQRTSVAFGLAVALEYLHEGSELQIIHGDVKSSNVLLDGSFRPKLCDFGSARMGFSGAVVGSDDNQLMMGSPGYVDPHYIRTGLVSKKSDVYSFGVLVLELVTGMQAFCEEEQRLLTAAMAPVVEEIGGGGGGEFVDPRLGGGYDEDEVRVMVGIAAKCTGERPVHRPSMGDVVKMMKEKLKWLPVDSKL